MLTNIIKNGYGKVNLFLYDVVIRICRGEGNRKKLWRQKLIYPWRMNMYDVWCTWIAKQFMNCKETSLIQSGGVRRDYEATATPSIGRCRPEASWDTRSIRGFEYSEHINFKSSRIWSFFVGWSYKKCKAFLIDRKIYLQRASLLASCKCTFLICRMFHPL